MKRRLVTALCASSALVAATLLTSNPATAAPTTCTPIATFTHCVEFRMPVGGGETWVVPADTTHVLATVVGAGGSSGWYSDGSIASQGGSGGVMIRILPGLTPGNTLGISVGGADGTNGGGSGGNAMAGARAGSGGGMSAVWSGAPYSPNPLLVAGGGGGGGASAAEPSATFSGAGSGGAGGSDVVNNYPGVDGEFPTSLNPEPRDPGRGGTQLAGGAGGTGDGGATAGTQYQGGTGGSRTSSIDAVFGFAGGGGGGGGYYGGGGGAAGLRTVGNNVLDNSGGGGGSSWAHPSVPATPVYSMPFSDLPRSDQNGFVRLQWTPGAVLPEIDEKGEPLPVTG